MSTLTNIVNVVLYGENNFCCVCLKIDENITFYNETNVQFDETEYDISVSSMLQTIFGTELKEYWSAFERICEMCLKTVLSIYTFIQTCQKKIMLFTKTLDSLNTDLSFTKEEHNDVKTLFVSLDNENLARKLTFDTEKCLSKVEALKRYKLLNTPKIQITSDSNIWKKKKTELSYIKTEDIIHDLREKVPRCKECLKAYPSLLNLRTHFLRVHASKHYKCPKCYKAYSLPSLVSKHLSIDHCEIVCSECGKIFNNRSTYNRHEFTHNLRIVCPDCGRVYKNNLTFKKHIELNVCKQERRANPVDAQYTCDYCGKKYTQKMSLRVHIQYNHGNYKPHVCKWCGKKFWAQSRLKAHIVKHTKEKNFTCSTCQAKFVTKESLLYHTRLHTGEKPYRCSQCDCTFISSSRRAYHMRTYHLQPIEECEGCHAKFTSRKYLAKHKKSHKQCQKVEKTGSKLESKKDDPKKKLKEQSDNSLEGINNPTITAMVVDDSKRHIEFEETQMSLIVNSNEEYVVLNQNFVTELIL